MTTLSIRPDYELATRYGAAWMSQIAGMSNIDLYGPDATAGNFFSSIETLNPTIISILGHGNYNVIVCQNNELLLQGGVNTNVLANRVVFNLSCRAGRDLATSAINEGCIGFLGYVEDFWIGYTGGEHPDGGMINPLADEVSRGFFESHNIAPISYIRGANTTVSYWASQDSFNYWIKVWEEIDSQTAALLVWNRDYQIMKPSVGPRPVGRRITPLLIAFAPLAIIPLTKHLKKIKALR